MSFPNRAVSPAQSASEVDARQNGRIGICRSSRKPRNRHRGKIVDVIAHEAYVRQRNPRGRGELLEGSSLLPSAFMDMLDLHSVSEARHQRRVLAGDQSHRDPRPAQERNTHNVGEVKSLPLLATWSPPNASIGENPVDVERNRLNMLERSWSGQLDSCSNTPQLLHHGNFFLVHTLHAVAHRLLATGGYRGPAC